MFLLRRPSEARSREFLDRQRSLKFSYPEVGGTRHALPDGYTIDRHRVQLGHGEQHYKAACEALERWEMFRVGWGEFLWPSTPLAEGNVVGFLTRQFGLWSLSALRVVYAYQESGEIERRVCADGTLPDHVATGEERFVVEWNRNDDSVWYEILAFSRPKLLLTRLAYPYMRLVQKRFAADSIAAMQRATCRSVEQVKNP